MHLCKYLRIFLLSSSLLFIPHSVAHAEVNAEVNAEVHAEVNENARKVGNYVGLTLTPRIIRENSYTHIDFSQFETILETSSDKYLFFECNGGGGTWFDHTDFTFSIYRDGVLLKSFTPARSGMLPLSDFLPAGTKFDTIRVAWDDKFKNATAGNVNISFQSAGGYNHKFNCEYNATIKEPEPEPEPPVVVPDTNINIDSSGDSSDILNSIVNAIKEFIASLLSAGMFIIKRAVALGVIFIGGRWLWRKVRQWLGSV